jgi:hypothetical protein
LLKPEYASFGLDLEISPHAHHTAATLKTGEPQMSEVKLNLVDAHTILCGTIHGSMADRCVAALSAEPETIPELEVALTRYVNPRDGHGEFASFRSESAIDAKPYDAGLVVIDLAARVVASESTYSQPGPEGEVYYHDGTKLTDIPISDHLPDDWRFVNSVEAYQWSAARRRAERQASPPLDARAVLYGLPLVEFAYKSAAELREKSLTFPVDEEVGEAMDREIVQVHADWLMTPRSDLRGRSPRDVMLENQNLINLDMDSRCMQWTIQGEGPPCLPLDSLAYRYGGFGTHEWVVYYDLVRFLLWTAVAGRLPAEISEVLESSMLAEVVGVSGESQANSIEHCIDIPTLDRLKSHWFEHPWRHYDGRTPAIIVENERRRLPITLSPAELIIDEDCECCRMMALDAEMGGGPTFWHLDGSEMEEEFAFSTCITREEWEAEIQEREEFNREFDRKMAEREQRIARGEVPDDEPWVTDAPF